MGTKYENLLESGSGNIIQSFYDNFLKSNADFRSKAGFRMTIIRESIGACCAWCADLAGTYDYDSRPDDVYARHRGCNCVVVTKTEKGTYQDAWSKSEFDSYKEARIARAQEIVDEIEKNAKLTARERQSKIDDVLSNMNRRKIGSQGQEIIDKATYNKLTKSFLKNGGIIIRGKEAEEHLKISGAYASYVPGMNVAFIKDDATVSDVLEEMRHAYQDRIKMFGDILTKETLLKREIEAQEYLIKMVERYKIPVEEQVVTNNNLEYYKRELFKGKNHGEKLQDY